MDIEFLRLTTDICYIIGGFYGGSTEENIYQFINECGDSVWLDMNGRMIYRQDSLSRLQDFALDKVAEDHSLGIDLFHENEE